MGIPPLSYNLRSLKVRWVSTLLTTFSIGATVAVLAGVLALEQGFSRLYQQGGRDDVVLFLRKGANSEGESGFPRDRAELLVKEPPEFAQNSKGAPLASAEMYLAVRRQKLDGGETNVPIRGVEPASFEIAGDALEVFEGRRFAPGADEILVGESLVGRIRGCSLGSTVTLNTTPFKVVGIFRYPGPFRSEIWGDLDRVSEALQRPSPSRVVAKLRPGADLEALKARFLDDKRVPAKVLTETEYLSSQTKALSAVLKTLGIFLGGIMGLAAVFTGTNSMLAALSARAKEIGILLAIGFRPWGIFLSFLFEAFLLGLLGGVVGAALVLPLHGVRTGTTNFQTFTEVAFAFQVTPEVLLFSIAVAVFLGLLGGLYPAWVASREDPVVSLRKGP